ncbi:MAG: O-antigen ligase family protein [Candidatus Firestonebacteria bacterium]
MEKILRRAILVLLFMVPLCSPEWFPYLNLIYPILVVSVFVVFIVDRIFIAKEGHVSSRMILPSIFLFSAFVVSAVFSKAVTFNLIDIRIIYSLLLFIISINVFTSASDRNKAALVLLGGAVFTAGFAFYQKFTGLSDMAIYLEKHKEIASNSIVYREFLKNIGSGRVFSTFLNANVFSGYLAMVLPVVLGVFLSKVGTAVTAAAKSKDLAIGIGTGLVVVILLAALAFTRSVGGMAALLAALLVFLLSVIKEKKRILLGSCVLAAVCSGTVLFLRPDILDFSRADNSILNRFGYFSEAVRMFAGHPFLGSGVNTYGFLAADGVKYPHNWYLQTLSETGILGFFALILFIYVLVKESIGTLAKMQGNEKLIFAGLFSGFCGFLFHNLFDIDSNFWQNSLLAFTLAGILASGFKSNTKEKKSPVLSPALNGFLSRNYSFIVSAALMAGAIILSPSRFENEALVIFVFLSALLFLLVVSAENKFVKTKLDLYIPVLLFTCFVSLLVSVNRFASFQAVYLLLGCVMLFYPTVNKINKAKDAEVFSFLIALGCSLVSLAGMVQYLWFEAERVDAFFPNPNLLGGFLAAGTGFLLYQLLSKKGPIRIFYAVSAVLSLICLLLTKSRGALLAFGVIVIFFLFALEILKKKGAVKESVRFRTTVCILLGLGILSTPLNPVVKRAVRAGIQDDAAYSRGKMAVSAYKLFKDRPFLGYGLNTFKDAAPKYRFPEGGTIGNYTRVAHHAHNEYLQTMAELGITGAVLILVFLFILVRRFLTVIKSTEDKEKIFTAFAVFTSLIGLLAQALVDFNFHCLPTLVFFVFLTGLLFSGYLSDGKNLVIKKPHYAKFMIYVAFLVVLLLLSSGMSYLSAYFFRAKALSAGAYEKNMKLSVFLNPLFADGYAEIGRIYRYNCLNTKDNKLFFESEKNFKEAIRKNSQNAVYHKNLGLLYFYSGCPSLALQEYAAAIRKSPYDVFLKAEIAGICFFDGKYEQAEKYAREAVNLEPNFAGVHGMLSDIYLKMKNTKASEYEKQTAVRIHGKYKDIAVIDYEKMLVSLGGKK